MLRSVVGIHCAREETERHTPVRQQYTDAPAANRRGLDEGSGARCIGAPWPRGVILFPTRAECTLLDVWLKSRKTSRDANIVRVGTPCRVSCVGLGLRSDGFGGSCGLRPADRTWRESERGNCPFLVSLCERTRSMRNTEQGLALIQTGGCSGNSVVARQRQPKRGADASSGSSVRAKSPRTPPRELRDEPWDIFAAGLGVCQYVTLKDGKEVQIGRAHV